MKELAKSDRDLLLSKEAILNAWIAQMEKDLNFSLNHSGSHANLWQEILALVAERLAELERQGTLSAALYQIDVSEAELYSEMQSGEWASWTELFAQRVMEREGIKVIFRYQYSNRG